jgi:hypothetical protein
MAASITAAALSARQSVVLDLSPRIGELTIMATYPGGIRVWDSKRDFSQTIIESHMNDIQTELVAAESVYGVNPQIATNNPGNLLRDYVTVTNRLTSMVRGEHLPYYQGALLNYNLHTAPQDTNPDVPEQDPLGRDLFWYGSGKRQRCRQLRLSTGETVFNPYHWEVPDRAGTWEPWCGLPMEQDDATIADGGWQRLPIVGQDDPFSMGIGDGLRLNQTGLWMINLKVDHTADDDTAIVRARRRARLEINGRDATLQHLVRENADNGNYLLNYVSWIEVLPAGTIITASARVDGTDLTQSVPVNAYLRAHLIRCTDADDDGMLAEFPDTIYKPPPPPPPPRPEPPRDTGPYQPCDPDHSPPSYSLGLGAENRNYAVEIRPGEWYGYYGWGTVGPQSSSFFIGIGSVGGVNI